MIEAATNFLSVLNMAATMAKKRDRVPLEQSDMCLALNIAKMAKGGLLCASIGEWQYLIHEPHGAGQEEKKRGVEFPGHNNMKVAIARHPAMVHQNYTSRCFACQNGTE